MKTVTARKWRSIDTDQFKNDLGLSEIGRSNVQSMRDVKRIYEKYHEVLKTLNDKHAPARSKSLRTRAVAPWYNVSIQQAKIRHRQCEKRWRRSRSVQDFEVYKKARNEVNKILFKSKAEYYKFKLSSTKDQNEVFKLARQLLNIEKPSVVPVHDLHSELAESFSEYFVSKIQRIRDGFSSTRNSGTIDYASCYQGLVLSSFSQVDEDEVSKLVKQMKNKSCQLDPVPTWLVKQCLPSLTPVPFQMTNLSFRLCEVPDDMKLAMVTLSSKRMIWIRSA